MKSPRRGQIFRLKSDSVGKARPVLVVSPVYLNGGNTLTAVPFNSQQVEKRRTQRTCVFFASGEYGLDKDCVAKTDEVSMFRLVELRLSELVGEVDEARMAEVSAALCVSLGITP